MAKNRASFLKRSRELEQRQRADHKRKRRQLKKQNCAGHHTAGERDAYLDQAPSDSNEVQSGQRLIAPDA